MTDKSAIRDAATVILIRDKTSNPQVLMGQRGSKAAFMPNKFVFPGGAVDLADADIPLASPINPTCTQTLALDLRAESQPHLEHALCVAAIRELFEETGQILGHRQDWTPPIQDWESFADTGYMPDASPLSFVFRAITPPGRPRRFDARFFLANADYLVTDPDDFSNASDELSHLRWIPLGEVRKFDLPFITEVVLAEVTANLQNDGPVTSVPFYKNDDEANLFLRLNGHAPID